MYNIKMYDETLFNFISSYYNYKYIQKMYVRYGKNIDFKFHRTNDFEIMRFKLLKSYRNRKQN